ncbi:MAG: hypothetical protein IT429_16775 [Gemmataceae bacterium]|nr:hypothetical protein [Gemmataceae bacterium]
MTTVLDPAAFFHAPYGEAKPLACVFGVRHLSPAAAHHLLNVLDALQPTAVLIEGPSDATEVIQQSLKSKRTSVLLEEMTKPPVALLAYTKERPVRSILYPLAEYSPEWVALTGGRRNCPKATRVIDLPAAVFLELHKVAAPDGDDEPTPNGNGKGELPDGSRPAVTPPKARRKQVSEHTRAYLDDPYEAIARLAGDPDHETWWERHFEHTSEPAAYAHQIFELGRGLRDLRPMAENDENLIREAYMRRCIHAVLKEGHRPEKVVVVCGAFHSAALTHEQPPMDDRQLKSLPKVTTSITLMPYSYYRLSSQSGYGAGNHAPAYFQRLHEERRHGHSHRLASRYLSEVCHAMRKGGQIRSPAEVIEGVRLAQTLAALNEAPAPTLRDLRDAAVTLLGRGEVDLVRPFLAEVEIGSNIGKLPKGVSRTALQDDFYLHLEGLRLEKYQVDKDQEPLELDLRENRFVKGEDAAFRDRNRSIFLHRLDALGLEFGKREDVKGQYGTARERWKLRWKPDCEIQLVEAALRGDTVEVAAAVALSERLTECERVDQAAGVVKDAIRCQLADALEDARKRLQAIGVEDTGFIPLARAVDDLAESISYKDVRQFDPAPLRPLLGQLFLRACLQLKQACVCDRQAAKDVKGAIIALNRVSGENANDVDHRRWDTELQAVAAADDLNSYLSGLACSIMLEKGRIAEDELAREVSRRLSPGVGAELGAGWFEGLVQGNRQALFSRLVLWRQLDAYIQSLQDDEFRQALVYLRRAFSEFEPAEIRRVVSNLAEISQEGAQELQASVDVKLSEEEAKKLQEQLGELELDL